MNMNDNNQLYLNKIKNMYNSLHDFHIENNNLYYQNNDKIYHLPLFINLEYFNQALFNLNPEDIINIIYVFQLLYKDNITDKEKSLLIKYTNKYYTAINAPTKDDELIFGLCIPIYTSYDKDFINKQAAIIIRNTIDEKNLELNNIGNNQSTQTHEYIRTLKKNGESPSYDYLEYLDQKDELKIMENAGFTTLFIILLGIFSTIIAFFIIL